MIVHYKNIFIFKGYVDLKTSFPLSRFLEGQSSTVLNFAVGGANAVTEVFLTEHIQHA